MAYPIKDAGYKHEPPWLDRAKEGEHHSKVPFRQDGGPLPPTTPAGGPRWTPNVDMDNAVKDHVNNMRFYQSPLESAAKNVQKPLPPGWDDAPGRKRGGSAQLRSN